MAAGIGVTCDLGKYLGIPILQKRINKDTFGDILERASSRLAGWRSKTLSLAGRLTLTKSVLSSLPTHTMSAVLMPQTTLDRLDKLAKSFLWGSSPEKRKHHLVSWSNVCMPKSEGGLGLRKAQQMNKALIAKLGWRLSDEKESLWARVLRAKYNFKEVGNISRWRNNGTWSSTWQSVMVGFKDVIVKGVGWVPGDGRKIRFWEDKWLLESPLFEMTITPIPDEDKNKYVKDFWRIGVGWDFTKIGPYVSEETRLRLMSIVIGGSLGVVDRMSWTGTVNGEFRVKSAYSILCRDNTPRPCMEKAYTRIWKVIAPEHVRMFLWLVMRQVIMTNQERHRRHLCGTELCQVCHVLRDCPAMEGIWLRLVPERRRALFFSQKIFEWVYSNLAEESGAERNAWPTTFAMCVWWGWKWRCGNVFGEISKCRDRVSFIRKIVGEVFVAYKRETMKPYDKEKVEKLIAWSKPETSWVKLNTDGASRGNPGLATAGGAIRDERGNWRGGFVLNIGICSAPLAELWGVYYGLYFAWENGFRRIMLEVDSEIVVGFLKKGINDVHPLSFLVRMCQGFISRDWLVRISHVYREANRVADGLANYAFSLPSGIHWFDVSPNEIGVFLEDDAVGSAQPR